MDITPLIRADQQVIQSYKAGRFKVSSRFYESGIFVFPDRTELWPADKGVSDLVVSDFQSLIEQAGALDVVLLGCGAKAEFLPFLTQDLKAHGLFLEVMDTGAACRTYNVLMAEGRRVVAALLPVT